MSDYTRRPFLASQTDNAVISQPVIFGTEHINLDGEFDTVNAVIGGGSASFELALSTESVNLIDVQFSGVGSLTLQEIVDAINLRASSFSPVPVEATAEEGVLAIRSTQSGYVGGTTPALIRVLPETSGFNDLAPLLGFAVHPHPAATVTAGDLASSSPRAMTQGNRPSSSFVARGEDRTSENFNRALHSLSKNLDNHQVKMVRGVAVPVVLDIPAGSPRLDIDGVTGEIKGIDLRASVSDGLSGILATDIFVDLPHDASLADISKYFAVLDSDWNEILHWDDTVPGSRVVGVGTVAYAPTGPGASSVFDNTGASLLPISNDTVFDTYRSVLSQTPATDATKQTSVTITEIIDGATIKCSSATFETNLVEPGDIVTISSSSYSTPINHNGDYIVDVVVSETEIVVRPIDENNLHLLNNDAGGSLIVKANGVFENNLYLGFEPRLPRMPAGGIKIVLGMKNEFGEVPRDFLLVPAVNSAEEVDAWVLKNLHQKLNFDGVYQGQGNDKGGGFHATVDGRPITLHMQESTNSRSAVRSGSTSADEILAGNLLQVRDGDEFTLADVGRSIDLTIGTDEYVDWRVHRLLDARTVELVPPPHQISVDLLDSGSSVSAWTLYDDFLPDFQAAISSVTESALAGGFHHTKVNDGTSGSDLSFAHFEHVTKAAYISTTGSNSNLAELEGTLSGSAISAISAGGALLDVDDLRGIYPVTHASTSLRSANIHGGKTFVKVTSTEYAGMYELYQLGPSTCTLRGLDGSPLSVTTPTAVTFAFYTLRVGVGVPIFGTVVEARAALSVHQEMGPLVPGSPVAPYGYGIRAGWSGLGAGLLVTANDSRFSALNTTASMHDVSVGPAIQVTSYAPAYGALIRVTGSPSASTSAGRGQSGVHVISDTSTHDLRFTESDRSIGGNWGAAGVRSEQEGHDPAGVFWRKKTFSTGLQSEDLYPATLVVEEWEATHVGAGEGMTLRGSLFSPRHESSGIYTGGSGTFNELRPGYTDLSNPPPVFWGDGAAWLGSPYLVAEVSSVQTTAAPAASASPTATRLFNLSYDYTVVVAQADIPEGISSRSLSELVHLGIELDGGTYAGTVVAVRELAGDIVFALKKQDSTSVPPDSTYSLRAYGRRWHYSYLDLADYSEIGTGIIAFDAEPGATTQTSSVSASMGYGTQYGPVSSSIEEEVGAGSLRPLITAQHGQSARGALGNFFGDLFSERSLGGHAGQLFFESESLGSLDARDYTVWQAVESALDGVRTRIPGASNLPFVSGDLYESGLSSGEDTFLDYTSHKHEVFARVVSGSTTRARIAPNEGLPGDIFKGSGTKIVVYKLSTEAGRVQLYFKGLSDLIANNTAFRIVFDAVYYGSVDERDITVALVDNVGDPATETIIGNTHRVTVSRGTTLNRYTVDFLQWNPDQSFTDTRDPNSFAVRLDMTLPPGSYPSLSGALGPHFFGLTEYGVYYIRSFRVQALEEGLFKGNLKLQGVLRAAGLRTHTPILGHQVVGPAEVKQLQNEDLPLAENDTNSSNLTLGERWFDDSVLATEQFVYGPTDSTGVQEGADTGVLPIFELSDPQKAPTGEVTHPGHRLASEQTTSLTFTPYGDAHKGPLLTEYSLGNVTNTSNGAFWLVSYSDDNNYVTHYASYPAVSRELRVYTGYGAYVRADVRGRSYSSNIRRWRYPSYATPLILWEGPQNTKPENSSGEIVTSNTTGGIEAYVSHVLTVVRYYRPYYEGSSFFKVGSNAATINAYHPYYDPLFYFQYCYFGAGRKMTSDDQDILGLTSYGADQPEDSDSDAEKWEFSKNHIDPSDILDSTGSYRTGDDRVNPDFWQMPGKTGFVVPLSPPHGAMLSKLQINLGFVPADGRTVPGGTLGYTQYRTFGVWRSSPTKTSAFTDWSDLSAWRAREGVTVRLWRYNISGDENQPQHLYSRGTAATDETSLLGFSELLHEQELDLSSESVGTGDVEKQFPVVIDMTAGALNKRFCDRRRYTYFATVEFYIGCRRKEGSQCFIPGWAPGETEDAKRTAAYSWTEAFPGIKPTAVGEYGEFRLAARPLADSAADGASNAAVLNGSMVHSATSFSGHLIRRRNKRSDNRSVVLFGTAFSLTSDQSQIDKTGSWPGSIPHGGIWSSIDNSNGWSIGRALYSAASKLGSELYMAPRWMAAVKTALDATINTTADGPIAFTTVVTPSGASESYQQFRNEFRSQALFSKLFELCDRSDSEIATPVVKFRGAKLSWITDRLSDGGW